jgi:hypothetical protein
MNETKFIFDSAEQWHGRGEERILCPNVTFDNSSPGKMTKRKMKLTIVPKWHKAFSETDKVAPYVHCRCT